MKIQFVIHADFEQPGTLLTWAKSKNFETSIWRPFAHEPKPDENGFDWLVVMGGPQSPLEVDIYPYLLDEIKLIQSALKQNKWVLGFCLGAQLLGEALGAKTSRSPNKEVGIFPIVLTDEGKKDPYLQGLPESFLVTHWHNDMPGLTKDCKVLACSEGCPRQIIRYKSNAYGFQCHPEVTRKDLQDMIQHCAADMAGSPFVQNKETMLSQDIEAINARMISILDKIK